jgi:glycine/D-amino acid oxidase-like deaminating enzyme
MPKFFLKFASGILAGAVSGVVVVDYRWRWMDDAAFDKRDLAGHIDDQKLGGYPMTLYCKSLREPHDLHPPLITHRRDVVDACVIGGGFAGLHTALALAEKGKSVVLLEGRRIGSGASGRCAGDAVVGFHVPNHELAEIVGEDKARELFQHSVMGYDRLKKLIKKYKIRCNPREEGSVTLMFSDRFKENPALLEESLSDARRKVDDAKQFGDQLQLWDKAALQLKGIQTDRFEFGLFQPRTITLNPLELCLGLARACESKGVSLYEASPATHVTRVGEERNWLVSTSLGSVVAKQVVLATSSAPASISAGLAIATTPISTAIVVTKPLEKKMLDKIFSAKCAVFDERFGLAYFRREGERLIYGGLAQGVPMERKWAENKLLQDLTKTFPKLDKSVAIEMSWQGRIDCRDPIFPLLGRHKGLWYALGFAGHGIVPTCAAGELIASAIASVDPKDKSKEPADRRYQLWNEVTPCCFVPPFFNKFLPPVFPCGGPFGMAFAYAVCKYIDFVEW